MPRELASLVHQIEWLADEVLIIKESLIGLATRVEALEHGKVTEGTKKSLLTHEALTQPSPLVVEQPDDEESWTQLGRDVLLPRVAAVSFMMVVALMLRTVSENGMVGQLTGALIGLAYAGGLIGSGLYLYLKNSRLAPVFPACGVLLLYAIIYETHSHFAFVSSQNVYAFVLVVETIVLLIGLRCRASVLLFLSVFSSSLVAMALDFTNTDFTLVSGIIFVNVVAGHLAARYAISSRLRWYTLVFSLVVWLLWSYKLHFALTHAPAQAAALGLSLYLPILLLFWAFYIYSSLWTTLSSAEEFGVFHTFLPAIVSGGAFFAANAVLKPWVGQQQIIGFVTVSISAGFMALVSWLAKRRKNDAPGGKEFVTAAAVLLVQGLSISVPLLFALPVWVVAAGVLTVRSDQWRSGGIRLISYLFQIFIVGVALQGKFFVPKSTTWWTGALIATFLSAMTLWLFSWCRKHPPDYESVYFHYFDKKDFSAVVLLIIGLFEAFAAARFIAGHILALVLSDPANALYCVQSIILNSGIVILLFAGLKMQNREVLMVAGLMVLVAAIKVFLFDLLRADGIPLVLSVFSFGVVAATSSLVMRKWSVTMGKKVKGEGVGVGD
jgi:hypothetical protein